MRYAITSFKVEYYYFQSRVTAYHDDAYLYFSSHLKSQQRMRFKLF